MSPEDERIALFLDYENLAIGARDGLGVSPFAFDPVADALAERGRVVARRAYADWSSFDEDRRLLARAQVELIEIPQRMGASRKNAADIKMAVDAIELAYERPFVSTFAIGTGDSDFTPLVLKLRELDKRVIGIGVASSTSALLPPACDEFLFYDRLPGIEHHTAPVRRRGRSPGGGGRVVTTAPAAPPQPVEEAVATAPPEPAADVVDTRDETTEQDLGTLVSTTLAGLARTADGPVRSSTLKRAILRKDPTFDESDQGFRGFRELLRHLAEIGVVALESSDSTGDPEVTFPENGSAEDEAFALLVATVRGLQAAGDPPQLSGLKDQMRKRSPDFSEKRYGFTGFLAFAKAARTRELIAMRWDDDIEDYVLSAPV